nr:hypothetical protein [Tanacetum cinerariifolium]
MQVALGRSDSDEIRSGLHKVSKSDFIVILIRTATDIVNTVERKISQSMEEGILRIYLGRGNPELKQQPSSSHFEVFQKYTDLCATSAARNVQNMANNARASDDIGYSVSNRRKRTAGNSQIMLTPVEATTSKRTRRFPTINSNMSVGHSSESQRVSRRVNAEGCSSAAAVGCSYTYTDLGDCTQRCRYYGASFTNLIVL